MKSSEIIDRGTIEFLPEEIIDVILSSLPVPSLLQCRLVRKSWRKLTDRLLMDNHSGLFLNSENQLYAVPEKFFDRVVVPPTLPDFKVVGSCNGFHCLLNSRDTSSIFVYKPFTEEYVELPKPRNYTDVGFDVLGFGINSITKKYKVVIVYPAKYPLRSDVEIISSGSKAWRNLGTIGHYFCDSRQVLVNNRLHALAWPEKFKSEFPIVSFDLGKEKFGLVSPPPGWRHHHRIMALGNYLAVTIGDILLQGFDIWVMKKYNVEESWIQQYRIGSYVPKGLAADRMDNCFVRLLGFLTNGDILLQFLHQVIDLVSYNPKLGVDDAKEKRSKYNVLAECYMIDKSSCFLQGMLRFNTFSRRKSLEIDLLAKSGGNAQPIA
ncbi:hypothetical protein ACFE04_018401 [Oxalis oulophora]